jgi:hypothetical protein
MNDQVPAQPRATDFDSTDKIGRKNESQPESVETATASEAEPIKELTPEEQMALYEKELKENDWGHQPC